MTIGFTSPFSSPWGVPTRVLSSGTGSAADTHLRPAAGFAMSTPNSFGSRGTLTVDGQDAVIYRLAELEKQGLGRLDRLPFSIRILLENALRFAGHGIVTEQVVRDLMAW